MPSMEERELERALEHALGEGPASTLMARLPPAGEELARRSDVAELGARIDALRIAVDARLEGMDTRLQGMDGRLEGMDASLQGMDGRLEGMDASLQGMDGRLEGMDARLNGMDAKIDGLRAEFHGLRVEVGGKLQHHLARSIYVNILSMIGVAGLVLAAARLA